MPGRATDSAPLARGLRALRAVAACSLVVTASAAHASPACAPAALPPGMSVVTLPRPEGNRTANVYVPAAVANTSQPVPLLLYMHGWLESCNNSPCTGDSDGHCWWTLEAEARGFVWAAPCGVGDSWNAGTCCSPANSDNIDDVGFLRALVDYIANRTCVDADRVFATGFSNGAMCVAGRRHRRVLACSRARRMRRGDRWWRGAPPCHLAAGRRPSSAPRSARPPQALPMPPPRLQREGIARLSFDAPLAPPWPPCCSPKQCTSQRRRRRCCRRRARR